MIVKEKHFTGGTAVSTPDKDAVDLAAMLRALVDDVIELRAKHDALMAKLDADSGVGDTNYAATQVLATQALTKA